MPRCQATCQSGVRCKKITNNGTGFCHIHKQYHSKECHICLNQVDESDKCLMDCCNNEYCTPCLYNWIIEQGKNTTCPTCRAVICDQPTLYAHNWGVRQGILAKVDCVIYEVHKLDPIMIRDIVWLCQSYELNMLPNDKFLNIFNNEIEELNKVCYKKKIYFKKVEGYDHTQLQHVFDLSQI